MMKQMKRLYTAIIVLLIGSQVIFGQDKNAKLDSVQIRRSDEILCIFYLGDP